MIPNEVYIWGSETWGSDGEDCTWSEGLYSSDPHEYNGPNYKFINSSNVAALVSTLTFILTCDQDQLMSDGMDRVRAVLKLADGE